MRQATVDVVIPVYRPGEEFGEILDRLDRQSHPPGHILVVNTEERYWREEWEDLYPELEVFHIHKAEFDHAATRNMGAGFSNADYILFLTQDAVPSDTRLIARLLRAFRSPLVKAAYARQLPKEDAAISEGLVRSFNYPAEGEVRTNEDLPERGIKTYFCSNSCAMYERQTFLALGGFTAPSVFGEDMLYTARLLNLGYAVAYVAEASVYHSHNYTNAEQFRRNFDNGVSQAMHPEVFKGLPTDREGGRLVKYVTRSLHKMGRSHLILPFYWQCFCRWLGFHLGKHYRNLPKKWILAFSMNRGFWDRQDEMNS